MSFRWLPIVALLAGCPSGPRLPDADGDGYTSNVDCDDSDPDIHPGAPEVCDGVDQDCNLVADEDYAVDAVVWYLDGDLDGHGKVGPSIPACVQPDGYADNSDDCDDTDGTIHPGADELCDAVDRDCDGDPVAGATDAQPYYFDVDEDGYAGTEGGTACELPTDASWTAPDCDDADPLVNPDATERCDLTDDDCDGSLGFDAVVSVDADTLADAVEAVPDGGEICLPPGEWEAGVAVAAKRVTVLGAGVDQTSLTGAARRFVVAGGGELTVQDLDFGRVDHTSGLASVSGSALVLRGVRVESALVHSGDGEAIGPLMRVADGRLDLDGVEIGSIDVLRTSLVTGLVLSATDSEVSLTDVSVRNVSAPVQVLGLVYLSAGSLSGGGITVETATLGHFDRLSGGGVLHLADGAEASLDGLIVRDVNVSNALGGVVFSASGATLDLDHVRVEGLTATGGSGGLLSVVGAGTTEIGHLAAVGAQATGTAGWVHALGANGDLTLRNLISAGNRLDASPRGGWLDLDSADGTVVRIENAVFLDESSSGTGSFALIEDALLFVVNAYVGATFAGQPLASTGCDAGDPGCGIVLDHVAVAFDTTAVDLSEWDPDARFDDIEVTDELTAPGFTATSGEPSTWDLHLLSTSPLIDAGNPDILDADGTRSDIGAYGGPAGEDW